MRRVEDNPPYLSWTEIITPNVSDRWTDWRGFSAIVSPRIAGQIDLDRSITLLRGAGRGVSRREIEFLKQPAGPAFLSTDLSQSIPR